MELLRPASPLILMQLYWLSIVFIGWSLIKVVQRFRDAELIYRWPQLPIAAKFVLSTAVGFAWFSLFTVVAYGLKLSAGVAPGFYIISLIAAVLYTASDYRVKGRLKTFSPALLISPLGILFAVIAVELFYSLFIGGFMGGDGFVHVSKIRHIVEEGFTLTDAYYGTVPETRHTISVLHTLLAIPGRFGIDPVDSWYASATFLKLVKISAVFYLAWRLLGWTGKGLRQQYAALATILSIGLFNNYFISYPSIFVGVWVTLAIIALYDLTKQRNLWLLPMAALLIAVTHPLAATAMVFLLGIVFVGFLVLDRKVLTKGSMASLVAAGAAFASTPLFTALLPNQMTEAVRNFAINDFDFVKVGRLEALRPDTLLYFTSDSFTAMPTWLAVLSVLGGIGLLWFVKDKGYRIITLSLLLYVPLVICNPVIFPVLEKLLPVWGIARFTVVNQLTVLMPLFGILLVAWIFKLYLRTRLNAHIWLGIVSIAVAGIFLGMQSFGVVDPRNVPDKSMYEQQSMVYGEVADIAAALPDDKGAIVLAERSWDSFIIPAAGSQRVMAIHDANSPPAADMPKRSLCFNKLYQTLDPSLMKQARVKYVLTGTSDPTFSALAAQHPQLQLEKISDHRTLYIFDSQNIIAAEDPDCQFNE